jgi:hypothetical protein
VRSGTANIEEPNDPVTGIAKLDELKVTFLLSDAALIVTGSVIDCDQTVHGSDGDHIPTAAALHA